MGREGQARWGTKWVSLVVPRSYPPWHGNPRGVQSLGELWVYIQERPEHTNSLYIYPLPGEPAAPRETVHSALLGKSMSGLGLWALGYDPGFQ